MSQLDSHVVRQLLDYDPLTGVFVWKERGIDLFDRRQDWLRWNRRYAGRRAGMIKSRDYAENYRHRVIKLFGIPRVEHRLAWLWMTDEPIPEVLDHCNQDATDNRWSNIRRSDSSHNSKNRSKQANNSSGVTGVSWDKKRHAWRAYSYLRGKQCYLGSFQDLRLAEKAVADFKSSHGFDGKHGKTPRSQA